VLFFCLCICVNMCARMSCVCVCVCVCVFERFAIWCSLILFLLFWYCVFVCVCDIERKRERKRERGSEREKEGAKERKRERKGDTEKERGLLSTNLSQLPEFTKNFFVTFLLSCRMLFVAKTSNLNSIVFCLG
jgi:hypothetical protein